MLSLGAYVSGDAGDRISLQFQLIHVCHERNHDFRQYLHSLFLDVHCGLKDRSGLHLGYFREDHSEAASPVAQHRIGFVKRLNLVPEAFGINLQFSCQFPRVCLVVGKEFMERRIQRSNSNGQSVHRAEYSLKIFALQLEKLTKPALI